MEKICFKCKRTLPIEQFYKHAQMGDGHLNKCKECTLIDARIHREKHLEKINAYDRLRRSTRPHSKPKRHSAHKVISNAVKYGRVNKSFFCVRCWATGRIHGHHTDYSRPLDVVWLCSKCHSKEHGKRKDCSSVALLREAI